MVFGAETTDCFDLVNSPPALAGGEFTSRVGDIGGRAGFAVTFCWLGESTRSMASMGTGPQQHFVAHDQSAHIADAVFKADLDRSRIRHLN